MCPNDIIRPTMYGQTLDVNFPSATATDSNNDVLEIDSYVPNRFDTNLGTNSGRFPVGTTVITATTERDANGLTNSCTFSVTGTCTLNSKMTTLMLVLLMHFPS